MHEKEYEQFSNTLGKHQFWGLHLTTLRAPKYGIYENDMEKNL
jgi:hypothetical protein